MKKKVVATRDIPQGTVISDRDVYFLRTDTEGVSPHEAEKIFRQSCRDLARYSCIREDDVD